LLHIHVIIGNFPGFPRNRFDKKFSSTWSIPNIFLYEKGESKMNLDRNSSLASSVEGKGRSCSVILGIFILLGVLLLLIGAVGWFAYKYMTTQADLSAQQTMSSMEKTLTIKTTVTVKPSDTVSIITSTHAPIVTIQPSQIPTQITPTATPTISNLPFMLSDWLKDGFVEGSTGCKNTNSTCWNGNTQVEKILTLRNSIKISSEWTNPYMVFSQSYDIPETINAKVSIKSGEDWQDVAIYREGKKSWHKIAIPLSSFKGLDILIRFQVPWGAAIEILARRGYYWAYETRQINSKWTIQDIEIIPDYRP
jgi:hypothetical protein